MRKVDIPLYTVRAVARARRRLNRRGHRTGRGLTLMSTGSRSLYSDATFEVVPFLTCRICGASYPCENLTFPTCRGYK